jgi:hypothetical protein
VDLADAQMVKGLVSSRAIGPHPGMDAGSAVATGSGSPMFETGDARYAWLHIVQVVAAGVSGTSTIETLRGHRRGDGPLRAAPHGTCRQGTRTNTSARH